MTYKTSFDPPAQAGSVASSMRSERNMAGRDLRDGTVYVLDAPTTLAVQVAMATGRPLLLGGTPGSGKSSLAAYVARCMGWNYFELVVTSATRAEELQWAVDDVRRLRDAVANRLEADLRAYIDPGALWWALNPRSARDRGFDEKPETVGEAAPPGILRAIEAPSVVLIDEIDKADPDVPNDCLVVLGSQQIAVRGTQLTVERSGPIAPFVLITSNDERSLSKAFMRRCVVHRLTNPSADILVTIAEAHFPEAGQTHRETFETLARIVVDGRRKHGEQEHVAAPSIAEYLDAVRACCELGVRPGDQSELWRMIESAILQKEQHGL